MRFPSFKRAVSLAISLIYFTTQIALGNQPEMNVWTERRKSHNNQFAWAGASRPMTSPLSALQVPAISLTSGLKTALGTKLPIDQLSPNLKSLITAIPTANGTIQEISAPTKDESDEPSPIVIVQDVHMNNEAQQNIAAILQSLIDSAPSNTAKTRLIGAIGIEGAFAPVDFAPFRDAPDQKAVHDVAQNFFETNRLAAPSYVGLTSTVELPAFMGIDDRAHYDANVRAYLDSRVAKTNVARQIEQTAQDLQAKKDSTFSEQLKKFDAAQSAYRKGTLGLGGYANELAKQGTPTGHLAKFLEAYRIEKSLNFERVEAERKSVLDRLARTLNNQETTNLLEESVAYRSGRLGFGGFYSYLDELLHAKGISLNQAPAFQTYLRYTLLADGIKSDQLFDDVSKLETEISNRLARTPEERRLLQGSERLALIGKLIDFSLTPQEWKKYQTVIPAKDELLRPFENFYREADIRSHRMFEQLNRNSSIVNRKPIALVVGGFHTPQITALLKEQRVPYIVVSPKITKIDSASGSAYLSVFARDKTPLEKLLSGEKLFLAPQTEIIDYAPTRWAFISHLPLKTALSITIRLLFPKTPLQAMYALPVATGSSIIGVVVGLGTPMGLSLFSVGVAILAFSFIRLRRTGVPIGNFAKLYYFETTNRAMAALHFNNNFALQRRQADESKTANLLRYLDQIARDISELAKRVAERPVNYPFELLVMHSHLWETRFGQEIVQALTAKGIGLDPPSSRLARAYERLIDFTSLFFATGKWLWGIKSARTLVVNKNQLGDLAEIVENARKKLLSRRNRTLTTIDSPEPSQSRFNDYFSRIKQKAPATNVLTADVLENVEALAYSPEVGSVISMRAVWTKLDAEQQVVLAREAADLKQDIFSSLTSWSEIREEMNHGAETSDWLLLVDLNGQLQGFSHIGQILGVRRQKDPRSGQLKSNGLGTLLLNGRVNWERQNHGRYMTLHAIPSAAGFYHTYFVRSNIPYTMKDDLTFLADLSQIDQNEREKIDLKIEQSKRLNALSDRRREVNSVIAVLEGHYVWQTVGRELEVDIRDGEIMNGLVPGEKATAVHESLIHDPQSRLVDKFGNVIIDQSGLNGHFATFVGSHAEPAAPVVRGGVLSSVRDALFPDIGLHHYARNRAAVAEDSVFLLCSLATVMGIWFLLGYLQPMPDATWRQAFEIANVLRWIVFAGSHFIDGNSDDNNVEGRSSSMWPLVIAGFGLSMIALPWTPGGWRLFGLFLLPMAFHQGLNRYLNPKVEKTVRDALIEIYSKSELIDPGAWNDWLKTAQKNDREVERLALRLRTLLTDRIDPESLRNIDEKTWLSIFKVVVAKMNKEIDTPITVRLAKRADGQQTEFHSAFIGPVRIFVSANRHNVIVPLRRYSLRRVDATTFEFTTDSLAPAEEKSWSNGPAPIQLKTNQDHLTQEGVRIRVTQEGTNAVISVTRPTSVERDILDELLVDLNRPFVNRLPAAGPTQRNRLLIDESYRFAEICLKLNVDGLRPINPVVRGFLSDPGPLGTGLRNALIPAWDARPRSSPRSEAFPIVDEDGVQFAAQHPIFETIEADVAKQALLWPESRATPMYWRIRLDPGQKLPLRFDNHAYVTVHEGNETFQLSLNGSSIYVAVLRGGSGWHLRKIDAGQNIQFLGSRGRMLFTLNVARPANPAFEPQVTLINSQEPTQQPSNLVVAIRRSEFRTLSHMIEQAKQPNAISPDDAPTKLIKKLRRASMAILVPFLFHATQNMDALFAPFTRPAGLASVGGRRKKEVDRKIGAAMQLFHPEDPVLANRDQWEAALNTLVEEQNNISAKRMIRLSQWTTNLGSPDWVRRKIIEIILRYVDEHPGPDGAECLKNLASGIFSDAVKKGDNVMSYLTRHNLPLVVQERLLKGLSSRDLPEEQMELAAQALLGSEISERVSGKLFTLLWDRPMPLETRRALARVVSRQRHVTFAVLVDVARALNDPNTDDNLLNVLIGILSKYQQSIHEGDYWQQTKHDILMALADSLAAPHIPQPQRLRTAKILTFRTNRIRNGLGNHVRGVLLNENIDESIRTFIIERVPQLLKPAPIHPETAHMDRHPADPNLIRALKEKIGLASIFDPLFRLTGWNSSAYWFLTVFFAAAWETAIFHADILGLFHGDVINIAVWFAFAHTIVAWLVRSDETNRDFFVRFGLSFLFSVPFCFGFTDYATLNTLIASVITFTLHASYNHAVLKGWLPGMPAASAWPFEPPKPSRYSVSLLHQLLNQMSPERRNEMGQEIVKGIVLNVDVNGNDELSNFLVTKMEMHDHAFTIKPSHLPSAAAMRVNSIHFVFGFNIFDVETGGITGREPAEAAVKNIHALLEDGGFLLLHTEHLFGLHPDAGFPLIKTFEWIQGLPRGYSLFRKRPTPPAAQKPVDANDALQALMNPDPHVRLKAIEEMMPHGPIFDSGEAPPLAKPIEDFLKDLTTSRAPEDVIPMLDSDPDNALRQARLWLDVIALSGNTAATRRVIFSVENEAVREKLRNNISAIGSGQAFVQLRGDNAADFVATMESKREGAKIRFIVPQNAHVPPSYFDLTSAPEELKERLVVDLILNTLNGTAVEFSASHLPQFDALRKALVAA